MKRRNFIRNLSGSMMGLPLALNGMNIGALSQASSLFSFDEDSDKVLVLIRLTGGNDGLNMLIPLDQYDKLHKNRSNIIIPENKVRKLNTNIGFHPRMFRLNELFEQGKLGIVQSVGYPNQNRSHFRSTDIWTSGSSSEEIVTSGWLGRHFDDKHPSFPEGYPNASNPDPIAITIGNTITQTCQGAIANFSMAVENPFDLSPLAGGQTGALPDTFAGRNLSFLHTAIEQTNAYSTVIEAAANKGNNFASYTEDNRLAQKLKIVAKLISGGLKTKIYVVTQGGYDTHSKQVQEGNTVVGEHAELLSDLSSAIGSFQDDLLQLGLDDRVLGMTFSEFGRRIKSNGSLGSDHGTAAPLMLFGSCVNPAILGKNPEIPRSVNSKEGVAMQFDFRSVYGSVLEDWFGVEESEIKEVLYEDYQHIPLVTCGKFIEPASADDAFSYPNPFTDSATITFESKSEKVTLSILDGMGREVAQVLNKHIREGIHRVPFSANALPAGNYYFYLRKESGSVTKSMLKR